MFVLLVGKGILEAKVDHLAALAGGDLQSSFGIGLERALEGCVQGMQSRRAGRNLRGHRRGSAPVGPPGEGERWHRGARDRRWGRQRA